MKMAPDKAKLTVEIPRSLWKAAKQRALDTDKDLKTVVIEALEAALSKKGGSK